MSRAACNIAGVLMSEELKQHGIPVVMLHPGFNRTEMTAKYAEIWDKEASLARSAHVMLAAGSCREFRGGEESAA